MWASRSWQRIHAEYPQKEKGCFLIALAGQVTYWGIRRSSASPRPPCDGSPSASIWPSPRQTPGPPWPYPSDRTPSGHRPGRRQARHGQILPIGLHLTQKRVDATTKKYLCLCLKPFPVFNNGLILTRIRFVASQYTWLIELSLVGLGRYY